jgi:hypothetical protein
LKESKDLKNRWKKLGSAISTARMVTRIGDFIDKFKFFYFKISKFKNLDLKQESILKWICTLADMISGIFDNWVFLARIGIVKYKGW